LAENAKSVLLINRKIKEGKAIVLSDREFVHEIRTGNKIGISDIDVVTTSWNAVITGTAAMLCVPVTKRGIFTRARKIWLNGVPGFPGPAPNERLGVVDTLIFAEQPSRNKQADYNGAMLFVDILRKAKVEVECLSEEGDTYRSAFTIDQLQFARMYIYNCFLDRLSVSDEKRTHNLCRHLAPIGAGSKILLNRALGIVIGSGTRSIPGRRAFSISAEMFDMDPGVMTSDDGSTGRTVTNSIALAIPVLHEEGLKDLSSWLLSDLFPGHNNGLHIPENDMSQYLRKLVRKGSFLLTESDMTATALDMGAWRGRIVSKGGGK
jgi:uncharacterized protein (DUF39 family)